MRVKLKRNRGEKMEEYVSEETRSVKRKTTKETRKKGGDRDVKAGKDE